MSEETRKHASERWVERIAGGIAALSVIAAALIHIINFLPGAYSTLFPRHDIKLLGFNSQERIVIANRGDYDYFISHVRYGPDYAAPENRELDKVARQLLEHDLQTMCEAYYDSVEDPGKINDCAERLQKAEERVERLERFSAGDGYQERWAPGFKNRGVADVLNSGVTRQFDLEDTRWRRCPIVGGAQPEQWEKLRALWVAGYQTIPGRCLNVEYYYDRDRNFVALTGQDEDVALLPAIGSLRYYSMNERDDDAAHQCPIPPVAQQLARRPGSCDDSTAESTDLAGCSVRPSCLNRVKLPTLVGVMRYHDSPFCVAEIQRITGFKATVNGSGGNCMPGSR